MPQNWKFWFLSSNNDEHITGRNCTFYAASRFLFKGTLKVETYHFLRHNLYYFGFQSVNKEGHFTARTKYLLRSISPSILAFSLKLQTNHFLRLRHNWYTFGCDRSITKGTLLDVQSTFVAAAGLLFKGCLKL